MHIRIYIWIDLDKIICYSIVDKAFKLYRSRFNSTGIVFNLANSMLQSTEVRLVTKISIQQPTGFRNENRRWALFDHGFALWWTEIILNVWEFIKQLSFGKLNFDNVMISFTVDIVRNRFNDYFIINVKVSDV